MAAPASASEIAKYACSPLIGNNDAYHRCTSSITSYTESVRKPSGVYLVNASVGVPVTFHVNGEYYVVEKNHKRQLPKAPTGRVTAHIVGQEPLSLPSMANPQPLQQNTLAENKQGSVLQAFSNGIWTQYVVGVAQPTYQPAYQPVYQPQYPASYQPQYRPVATHPSHPQGWYPPLSQAPVPTCDSVGSGYNDSGVQVDWCSTYVGTFRPQDDFTSPQACRDFVAKCQAESGSGSGSGSGSDSGSGSGSSGSNPSWV